MFSTIFLTLLSLAGNVAAGQVTTTAVCTTDTWTTNDEGQSPCLVTSALQAACDGGNFEVPALLPGQVYFGPQLGFGNPCTCSTVTYSMAMACGACQGAGINKWSTWMTNCTPSEVSISLFPLAIPSSVSIPAWAYQNVTAHDLWDANEALATANEHKPDSSAVPQPTGQSSSTSNNPSPSTGSVPSRSKSTTNVAAIAGGAAGGVVLIILLVVAIFFLRRLRLNKKPRKADVTPTYVQPWTPNEQEKFLQPNSNNPSPDYQDAPPLPTAANSSHPAPMMPPVIPRVSQQLKPYDPSDPSTFPVTPTPFPHDQASHVQQPPSSGSVRSFQLQAPSLPNPSTSALSYNSSNPNLAPYPASPTNTGIAVRAPYAAASTRSEYTNLTYHGPTHVQQQPALLDPSQYIVGHNVTYGQTSYNQQQQQRGSGRYTGAAEI